MRLESTVLSDLSANVFAALLLILLILLQTGAELNLRDPTRVTPPKEATTDPNSHARQPMRSGDLVALFYDRRPAADGLSLDLTHDGLNGIRKGRPLTVDSPPIGLAPILRETNPGDPVRLYVFSHRHYGATTQALLSAGLSWQEISIPQALRDPIKGGWSQRFLALLDRGFDQSQFRSGLAHLLAASPEPLSLDGRVSGATGTGTSAAIPATVALQTRLLHWLSLGFEIVATIAGIGAVVAIETLVPRPRARYSDK